MSKVKVANPVKRTSAYVTALSLLVIGGGCRLHPSDRGMAAGAVQFASPAWYAAGSGPVAVTAADFNHDGILDLAVANRASNTVSVLLGKGGGAFAAPVSYAAGSGPVALTTADLRGNGRVDLVVADNLGNAVSVLAGNGDGTFRAPVQYATPLGPQSIAVGDLNRDGKPDVVVATGSNGNSGAPGTISVLSNRGNGTLLPAVSYHAGTNPFAVAIASLGDRHGTHVLAAGYDATNSIAVLAAHGRSGFTAPVSYAAGNGPCALALGDFNGDGITDVAVADYYGGTVSVLLGRRAGGFAPARSFPAGYNPESIAAADFNGDGHLDLLTADPYDHVNVLLGNGDGTFQAPIAFTSNQLRARSSAQSLAVGDFNGDGAPDVAVADLNNGNVGVLLNGR